MLPSERFKVPVLIVGRLLPPGSEGRARSRADADRG